MLAKEPMITSPSYACNTDLDSHSILRGYISKTPGTGEMLCRVRMMDNVKFGSKYKKT